MAIPALRAARRERLIRRIAMQSSAFCTQRPHENQQPSRARAPGARARPEETRRRRIRTATAALHQPRRRTAISARGPEGTPGARAQDSGRCNSTALCHRQRGARLTHRPHPGHHDIGPPRAGRARRVCGRPVDCATNDGAKASTSGTAHARALPNSCAVSKAPRSGQPAAVRGRRGGGAEGQRGGHGSAARREP